MLGIWFYTIFSVAAISLISLIGAISFLLKKGLIEKIVFYLVALAAGTLLGDVFIHIFPELARETGFNLSISLTVLGGILIFFLIEKYIHWHHCHRTDCQEHGHPVGTLSLFSDTLHNFVDGAIIAGSYLVDINLGIITTLAVLFHELPQEMGDFGVLIHSGFSKNKALWFNFLSSSAAFLGAILILFLGQDLFANLGNYILAFTAGGFIYIASSDLIPELHKETQPAKSFWQISFFLLGIGLMVFLLNMG